MQLVKVPAAGGGYRYAMPATRQYDETDQLESTLQDSLLQLKRSDRFLALDVRPGNGPVVANLMRKIKNQDVFTAIGDDSNVLVVSSSAQGAQELAQYLKRLAE